MARLNGSGLDAASDTSHRGQAFAALPAAVAQRGAAALAAVAREKTMLPLPTAFGRLILSFHKFNFVSTRNFRPQDNGFGNSRESERRSISAKF